MTCRSNNETILRIKTYKSKTTNKYYKITYFKGIYYFVHISKDKIKECTEKIGKDGKKYLEYKGKFITEDNTIII